MKIHNRDWTALQLRDANYENIQRTNFEYSKPRVTRNWLGLEKSSSCAKIRLSLCSHNEVRLLLVNPFFGLHSRYATLFELRGVYSISVQLIASLTRKICTELICQIFTSTNESLLRFLACTIMRLSVYNNGTFISSHRKSDE